MTENTQQKMVYGNYHCVEVHTFRAGENSSLWESGTTLFDAMELYLTKGIPTEILAVTYYPESWEGILAGYVWDLHLANNYGVEIDQQLRSEAESAIALRRARFTLT